MKKPSDPPSEDQWQRLIGLGGGSMRKSYYPELQRRLDELERFRVLLDNSFDLILLLANPGGVLVDVNTTVCRELGITRDDLLRHSLFDFVVGDDRPRLAELLDVTPECRRRLGVLRLVFGDGVAREVEVSVDPVSFHDEDYLAVVARDISARRRQEEVLLHLVQGVATAGSDFFTDFNRHLLAALGCDLVLIGEADAVDVARCRCMASAGGVSDCTALTLSGGPWRRLMDGEPLSIPCAVREAFPHDRLLAQREAQGLLATPLFGDEREVLGLLAVFYREPVAEPAQREAMLRIFAMRLAAELERERRQRELRESEQRFRTIFQTAPDAVAFAEHEGTILAVNDNFLRLTGYTAAEIIGRNSLQIGLWRDPADRERMLAGLVEKGEVDNVEANFVLRDGSEKIGLLSARVIHVSDVPKLLIVVRDITRIKEIEAALRKSETRFRTLVDNLPAAVYRLRGDDDFGVVYMSPAIAEICGYPAEDFISGRRSFVELIEPEERDDVLATLRQAHRLGQSFFQEFHVVHPDGSQRWLLNRGLGGVEEEGTAGRHLDGMLFDITERKRAEEALLRLDREKDEFISTAAHELRTPLTSVLGYAELLHDADSYGGFSSEEARGFLDEITRKGESLSRIVDELLDISRIQFGQELILNRKPEEIAGLVDEVRRQFELISRKHRFSVRQNGTPRPIAVDRGRLVQVLENLLSNAVKYSPAGGEIIIHLRWSRGGVKIAVEDHGLGMTAEQVRRIFDKFYRGDMSNTAIGGLGLGMSIVRQIVVAHAGRIEVSSTPGQGTLISVHLPG